MSSPTNFYKDAAVTLTYGIEQFEICLKYAGYVPVVSTISGGFRIVWGTLELISAVALAIILRRKDPLEFALSGLGNIVRGHVECRRWMNLMCPIWDNFVPPIDYRRILNLRA